MIFVTTVASWGEVWKLALWLSATSATVATRKAAVTHNINRARSVPRPLQRHRDDHRGDRTQSEMAMVRSNAALSQLAFSRHGDRCDALEG